jgi:hypothetical protein
MPLENWVQHSRVDQFLYDWQTLIAGVLAVVAAAGTIWATIKSANREIAASQAQTDVAQKQIETTIRLAQTRRNRTRRISRHARSGDGARDLVTKPQKAAICRTVGQLLYSQSVYENTY